MTGTERDPFAETRPDLEAALIEYMELWNADEAPEPAAYCAQHPAFETVLRQRIEDFLSVERALGSASAAANRDDQVDAAIGKSLGEFRIARELGRGGMGVVYLAEQENPRREVALKVVLPGRSTRADLSRFRQEVHLLAQMRHPAIAQVYLAGSADAGLGEQPYFVMEYVDGQPLLQHAESRALDLDARIELLARIGDGIHHAHERGIVHRDLKPANILVQADGTPKILDFGVARVVDPELRTSSMVTEAGLLIGTLLYMSPEQVGDAPDAIDRRSDVYALGVVGYELLSGRLPYELAGKSVHEVLRIIADEDPVPLSAADPALRGDLETVVAKALAKEPAFRYASAGDFADDLRRVVRKEPVRARPASTWYQVRRFASRNPRFATSLAALVVVLVVGLVVSLHMQRRARDAAWEAEEAGRATLAKSIEAAATRGDWTSVLQQIEGPARDEGLDTWETRLWQVEALMSTGQRTRAHERLDGLLARADAGPHRAPLLLLKGDLALDDSDTAGSGVEMLREALALGLDDVDAAYVEALLSPKMTELADRLGDVLIANGTHFAARQRRIVALFFLARFGELRREAESLRLLYPDDTSVVVIEVVVRSIEAGELPTEAELAAVEAQLGEKAADAIAVVCRTFRLAKEAFEDGAPGGMMLLRLLPALNALSGSVGEGAELGVTIPRLPALETGLVRVVPTLVALGIKNDPEAAVGMLEEIVEVNPEGTLFFLLGSTMLTTGGDRLARDSVAKAYLLRSADTPSFITEIDRRALELVARIDAHHWSPDRPDVRPGFRASGVRTLHRLWNLGEPDSDEYLFMVKHAFHFEEFSFCRLLCTEAMERFPEKAAFWRGRRGIAHCYEGNYGSALPDLDAALAELPDDANVVKARRQAAEKLGMVGPPGEAVPGAEYLGDESR